jgi:glycosyltransferase involved in cell wall biosynthesis
MKLLLIPDPTSPYGEDAFCREISKRAAARGHETTIAQSTDGNAAGADLILVNSLQPAAVEAALQSGRRVAVRFIDSCAGMTPEQAAGTRDLALRADLILVPSAYLAGIVSSWGANGKVRQVPYAYDRIMAQTIALVTIRASKPVFQLVAVNALNEATRPGFETLLSALARLRIDCHLSIVGQGPALPALKERVGQLVIGDKVTFMEPMPHAKLMEFFRAAKAYIDPCAIEGFPALALHALSEGCPVIAARAGAAGEIIRDQENGLLVTAGDPRALSEAIVTLWSVRGLSLRLIAEGIKTVGSHSWDRTVGAVFDAVESLK